MSPAELELADWRRRVAELYAQVRSDDRPEHAHQVWRAGRDILFRTHPQSPLPAGDPLRETGLPYWPYDPALRFDLQLLPPRDTRSYDLPAGDDGTVTLQPAGRVEIPAPVGATVDVWWMRQYGGGLFLPL